MENLMIDKRKMIELSALMKLDIDAVGLVTIAIGSDGQSAIAVKLDPEVSPSGIANVLRALGDQLEAYIMQSRAETLAAPPEPTGTLS
jgi:hypothetical protein